MIEPNDAPTFTCVIAHDGPTATVSAVGEIDLASSPELRRALDEALDGGAQELVLDLGRVGFIDSSGLGVLVGVHTRVDDLGRRFVIRGVEGPVRRVFEITGLHEVFEVES